MPWTTEDTLKVLGLILFIGAFVIVFQQLFSAESKLGVKEDKKKKKQLADEAKAMLKRRNSKEHQS